MLVMVADDGGVPLRRPGAAARRDEEKATFIQESEVRPQAAGFFLTPATGSVANGQWHVRRAAGPAAPAPDSSSPNGARFSTHVRGVIVHAKGHPNHGGDALQGPQLVGEAVGSGALQQQLQPLGRGLVCQLVGPSRRWFGG